MVAAVRRHGYPETTVAELVGLAGVSKSTFYQHFESKEECFFSTFDRIIDEVTERVATAYRSQEGVEKGLAAAIGKFAEFVIQESPEASIIVLDSLSLGAAAVRHIDRAGESFELMLRQSLVDGSTEARPSDLAVRAIVGAIRTVVSRCLRAGRPDDLKDHLGPLVDLSLTYLSVGETPRPAAAIPIDSPEPEEGDEAVGWEEPADSARSRDMLSQRERILRAAAQVVAHDGYSALTIPAISAAAGTSNQTFYEHFERKEQAFLAAFGELSHQAVRVTVSAAVTQTEWPGIIEAGMRGLLQHTATEPLFAQLAFVELPAAGAAALDNADEALESFTGFLSPQVLPDGFEPLTPMLSEAIGGAVWGAIQHEIITENQSALPGMAPQICDIALLPLRRREG
jgi:AcrR family transcriptional regulator